ncbi:MAG: hypothetical protein M1840_008435 [Geoglossum simile]|nr:MAG: hypothetical protein M1840_008435 [Geoglossum simile]
MITWSSPPNVQFTDGTSSFKLAMEQLVNWEDFEADMRANANASLGPQTQIIPAQAEKEVVHVGNEHGLMSRFNQNIGHVMGEVFRVLQFADRLRRLSSWSTWY